MSPARRQIRRIDPLLPFATLLPLLLCGVLEVGHSTPAWGQEPPAAPPRAEAQATTVSLPPDLVKQMDQIRARILSRRGLVPESLSLYRELRERFPGDKEIWIDFIETLVNEGLYEAADDELSEFLDRHPGDLRALRIRARVFFELERFESAYPVYDRLLASFPEDAGVWADYGYARQEAGDWAGALDCFSRVLEIDPENGDALRSTHWILRDHLPRLDTGFRLYRQEEGDAEWGTGFLRHERHLTERTWWTFSYERVRMERPEQPFLEAVDETLHDAALGVDYRFNRVLTGRAGAGLFSGMGGGTPLSVGVEARPVPSLRLRADYAHGRPWYDPMEAVLEEGRENRLAASGEWSGWAPWTLFLEADRSDYEVRELREYGRERGILGMLSRRFGENPFLLLSYSYARRRFEYGSETFRPVLLIERETVHGVSALFEHRPCTYWTYRLYGGFRRDTFRELDTWFVVPEVVVRMGNRLEARFSFEHSSEAGTVAGGTTRTYVVGLRLLF